MKIINWGIIGTGNIANSFATDFTYSEGGKLIAVASRSIENAIKFAQKFKIKNIYGSYEELYNDPEVDVVYIATPHNLHFKNVSDAIKKGKAVLCEKPITINPEECHQLIDLCRSTNTYLMEAMWTYFLPPILKAREWIAENRIGDVRYMRADFGFKAEFKQQGRLFNPDLAGGALLDIGIYPIALAWLIYNQVPEQITVNLKRASTGVDTEEIMVFKYKDGSMANLTASLLYKMPNDAIIIGDQGYIKIPDFFMANECFLYNNDDEVIEHYLDQRKSKGYNYEINAVNQNLLSGKKQSDVIPLSTSIKLQEIMAMVYQKF